MYQQRGFWETGWQSMEKSFLTIFIFEWGNLGGVHHGVYEGLTMLAVRRRICLPNFHILFLCQGVDHIHFQRP